MDMIGLINDRLFFLTLFCESYAARCAGRCALLPVSRGAQISVCCDHSQFSIPYTPPSALFGQGYDMPTDMSGFFANPFNTLSLLGCGYSDSISSREDGEISPSSLGSTISPPFRFTDQYQWVPPPLPPPAEPEKFLYPPPPPPSPCPSTPPQNAQEKQEAELLNILGGRDYYGTQDVLPTRILDGILKNRIKDEVEEDKEEYSLAMNGGRGAGGGKNILLADENTKPKKRSRRQESQEYSEQLKKMREDEDDNDEGAAAAYQIRNNYHVGTMNNYNY